MSSLLLRFGHRRNLLRLAAAFAVLALPCLVVAWCGLSEKPRPADLAVVLGSKVYPNGTPSPALQSRLDEAVRLYRKGYFKLVLVSGAHGREGYDEPVVMRRYLEAHGIPSPAIIEDNAGTNTWLTAQNTAALMKDRHLQSALIISQYFHLPRCRLAFARFGIPGVSASASTYWSLRDLYSLPREVIAYPVYAWRKPGDEAPL